MESKISGNGLYTFAIIICIALIYLGFISQSYNYDGTVFSLALRYSDATGDLVRVVHPHHLLYQPLAHLLYKLLKLLSFEPITVFALQLMGITFSLIALVIFYFIIKSICQDSLIAFLIVPFLAFSYAYWLFSIEAEVYIMSSFFLMITFWVMIKNTSDFGLERSLLLGIVFGLAVLAHLSNIILLPLCLFCIIKSARGIRGKAVSAFSLTAAGIIGVPYLYTLSAKGLSTFEAIRWWLMGPTYPGWTQGSIGARWSFGLKNLLLSLKMIRDIFLSDANYISSSTADRAFNIIKIPLTLCLTVLFLFFLYHIKYFTKKYQRILPFVILWLCFHFIFFSLWDAGNKELWITSIIPFIIILAMAFKYLLDSRFARTAQICLIVFIASIFSFNFFFSIYPQSKLENNRDYLKALFVKEHSPPGSLIILLGFPAKGYNFGKIYLPYFAEREILVLDWDTGFQQSEHFVKIEEKIAQRFKQNSQIFILSEVLSDNQAMRAFLASHHLSRGQWGQFWAKYRMLSIAEFNRNFKIFRLLPP